MCSVQGRMFNIKSPASLPVETITLHTDNIPQISADNSVTCDMSMSQAELTFRSDADYGTDNAVNDNISLETHDINICSDHNYSGTERCTVDVPASYTFDTLSKPLLSWFLTETCQNQNTIQGNVCDSFTFSLHCNVFHNLQLTFFLTL